MDHTKILDTFLTTGAAIIGIQWFSTLDDVESIYTMFVQSLVATAAIGKILFDIIKTNKNEKTRNNDKNHS